MNYILLLKAVILAAIVFFVVVIILQMVKLLANKYHVSIGVESIILGILIAIFYYLSNLP